MRPPTCDRSSRRKTGEPRGTERGEAERGSGLSFLLRIFMCFYGFSE